MYSAHVQWYASYPLASTACNNPLDSFDTTHCSPGHHPPHSADSSNHHRLDDQGYRSGQLRSMANFGVHRLYVACILSLMASTATFRESRRSIRVPLKVVIAIEGGAESRTCEGETIVVNLHGALIATAIGLSTGMKISIHVYLTDKRAAARVVYTDPKNPLHCGIELAEPRNIWGVPLPPDDWDETAVSAT
jgi:hypothetical protein